MRFFRTSFEVLISYVLLLGPVAAVVIVIIAAKALEGYTYYYFYYNSAIPEKTPVVLKKIGLKIGEVRETEITPPNYDKVKVTVAIKNRYASIIKEGTIFYVDSGLFGMVGQKIVVKPGKSKKILPEGTILKVQQKEAPALASSMGDIISSLKGILRNVQELTSPKGELMGELKNTLVRTRMLIDKIRTTPAVNLLLDKPMYNEVLGSLRAIRHTLEDVAKTTSYVSLNIKRLMVVVNRKVPRAADEIMQSLYTVNDILKDVKKTTLIAQQSIDRNLTYAETILRNISETTSTINTQTKVLSAKANEMVPKLFKMLMGYMAYYLADINEILVNIKKITTKLNTSVEYIMRYAHIKAEMPLEERTF